MPLHTIQKVSDLVPEAAALIKRASLEQNLPTGSKDETLISALELEYMIKVAHTHVELEDAERVCRAVELYGISDEVRAHTGTLIKAASVQDEGELENVGAAVDFISSQLLYMSPDLEKVAEASERLWDEHSTYIDNDQVKLYAGAGTLVKEAAIAALHHRAKRTGDDEFEKIAQVISDTDPVSLSTKDNRAIISAIRGLEKAAHYMETDLYKDMFMTKEAAQMVNLGNKRVDATDLVKIASHVSDILGSDIGELLKTAHSNAAAIEALPMGERQAIAGLI